MKGMFAARATARGHVERLRTQSLRSRVIYAFESGADAFLVVGSWKVCWSEAECDDVRPPHLIARHAEHARHDVSLL
jgi:hypothetical protein